MNPFAYYNENGRNDQVTCTAINQIKHVRVGRRRGYYFTAYNPYTNPIVVIPIGFTGAFSSQTTDENETQPFASISNVFNTYFRDITPIESGRFLEYLKNEAIPNFEWERHEQPAPISLDPQNLPDSLDMCIVAIEREYLDLLGEQLYEYCERDNKYAN